MEIERKWLVSELPELLWDGAVEIEQYYLLCDGCSETRVRRKGKKYFLTVKVGEGLNRAEVEREIAEDEFNELIAASPKSVWEKGIRKTRYLLGHIEVDKYHGSLKGLVVAEVEFTSEEEAYWFTPPMWFGEEVTENNDYKNKSLALHGRPKY